VAADGLCPLVPALALSRPGGCNPTKLRQQRFTINPWLDVVVNQVIPHQGVAKKPWFLCTAGYWQGQPFGFDKG